ncbi:unnamed protein product [Musa acuminata subsp. burmannicoides]
MASDESKWDALLRWSLSHADGTLPARVLRWFYFVFLDEDRKWFMEAMQAKTIDVV